MTISAPRIAVPEPTSTDQAYNQRSLPQYLRAIEASGGVGVTILLNQNAEAQIAVLKTCAGILLPGSPADVDPLRYGQQPVEACAPRDEPREAADALLLQDAFATGKPLFGICFGLQSLNVWRHGSLIQDLPQANENAPEIIDHQPGPGVIHAHSVVVTPGTRLADTLQTQKIAGSGRLLVEVNSSHHQAIDQPGEQLRVAATSAADGIIEALETVDPEKFILAVQWHPERSYEASDESRALFTAFLDAARQWQALASGTTPSIPK
jgi:putative glutamine amidotransferase